jgi:hypothetical protein
MSAFRAIRNAVLNKLRPLPLMAATSAPALIYIFDAIAIDTIPSWAEYFLTYESTIAAVQARFPNAKKLWRISTSSDVNAFLDYDGIDSEFGDATEVQAAQWAYNKIHANLGRPFIYIEVANKPIVTAALAALGLEWGRDVDCWLAWWNGVPIVPNGVFEGVGTGTGNVACQYFNQSKYTYDCSVALASWAIPPPPPPPPPPKPTTERETMLVRTPTQITDTKKNVLLAGTICLVSPAGAVNLGDDWPTVQAAYPDEPLIESGPLLARFTSIALH